MKTHMHDSQFTNLYGERGTKCGITGYHTTLRDGEVVRVGQTPPMTHVWPRVTCGNCLRTRFTR